MRTEAEDKILNAAQAIAGATPVSENLIAGCHQAVFKFLVHLVRHDENIPGRADLRTRIEAVKKAAHLILDEVNGPDRSTLISDPKFFSLYDYLLREDDVQIEEMSILNGGLSSLIERCEQTLDGLSEKGGRSRALAPIKEKYTYSGTVVCAMLVSQLWENVHGRKPSSKDINAQQACAALWAAAGGIRSYWGDREIGTVWREDLRKAAKARATPQPLRAK